MGSGPGRRVAPARTGGSGCSSRPTVSEGRPDRRASTRPRRSAPDAPSSMSAGRTRWRHGSGMASGAACPRRTGGASGSARTRPACSGGTGARSPPGTRAACPGSGVRRLPGEPAPRPAPGMDEDGRTAAGLFRSEEAKRILFAMGGATATSRFVGRRAELGRLEAAFAYASGGDPVTLCVGGEAGVGKTRLVTRFAGQVRGSGGQVLLGGCIELGEGSLPYAPVVEALRGLGRGLEPAVLDELVGPGRPLLARLLPELGQGEESTSAGLAVGSSAQARLFEAFLALLERLADRSPTVLVVEDLHWADRSTLDLLTFLVRNLRAALLLVLTYRTDELHRRHPLRPFLAGLDRSGRAERLEVDRFDRVDLADLLAGILGTRPDDELVEGIYRRSEGNAFFAEELLATTHQGNGRSLPPSLENVLLSRVQVLPEDAQATLRIVAAASGRVEHELFAAPARLAYHWVRAHDPARALPAAVEAGLQSEAAYGFADAQRHFETALELWDQVADAEQRLGLDHAAVLQHAAESAYLAGDPNRAITLTQAALVDVEAAKDPVRAGLLHGRLGGYLRATGGEGAFAEYEAAVRLVPTSPPLAERAQVLAAFGEVEAATAVALEGAELAASQGLGRWHSPFLTATAARALFALGRWDDAEVLLHRAADRVAPELAAARVYIHTARSQLDLARGLAASAAEHLAVAREAYAQTVTQPWFATPLFTATAELAMLEGRLGDADAAVAEGLRVAGADLIFDAPLYALGLRAAADRAELARARRTGDEVLEAREVGNALAGELRARMSPERADGTVPTPRTEAQAVLCEAELARLGGHSDPDLWAAAAKAWQRLGEPYPTAYARWREAEALLLGGLVREQVEPSLRAAHATASELGAASLRAEIEALARRGRLNLGTDAATTPPPAPEPPSPLDRLGLTAREQEVLALVAIGRTNRQIAETLFISPKTATVHVSNILGKLGVRSRVEAATIAHRLGIVKPGS